MAKYLKESQKKVEASMKEMKEGKLKSGRSGKKVTDPKQAIAIGLSEAREKGAKVPAKKTSGRSATKNKPLKVEVKFNLSSRSILKIKYKKASECCGLSYTLFNF